MPLSEVRKGMKGHGLTVFDGDKVEKFEVDILGVLRNISPGQDLILAHVDSAVIKSSGVIAGMSGSPVYIDGKVIGALAYSWQFSRDSVAGITPIEEMLRIQRYQGTPATRNPSPVPAAGMLAFLSSGDPEPAFQMLTRRWSEGARRAGASGALPISTPLSIGNFSPATLDRFGSILQNAGFLAVPSGTAGSDSTSPAGRHFAPGDAVSAVLVDGSFSLAANGTVTHVDGDRVYGFGHPFLDMGPIAFPMAKAEVVGVLPSLAQSFKFSNTGPIVGTFVQDRGAGILGLVGHSSQMVPVSVRLKAPAGEERFDLRIVDHPELFPLLLAMSTDSVISSAQRAAGDRSVFMDLQIHLKEGRTIRLREGWAGAQARATIPMYLAVLLNYVTANAFDPVSVERIEIDLVHSDLRSTAQLLDATLVSSERIQPGSTVNVRVRLRPWRGEILVRDLTLTVPEDARPGPAHILVGSGTTDNQARFTLVPPDPRRLEDLLQILEDLRPATELTARLLLPLDGRVSGGSYHPGIPPSIAAVLDDDASNSSKARVRLDPRQRSAIDVEQIVTGATRIDFRIEPRQ